MASILKLLKTIRNNWKKSLFATCAITYGTNYAKESYEIQNLMESYCNEALKYGQQPLQSTEVPKKILVILNPTANRRKAQKQFEQYCVPILHLAGICVEVVQTKREGHAKTILEEYKKKPDAIIIAGGDGTLSESITGYLRHNAPDLCPIGVLPLGRENKFAGLLFGEQQTRAGKLKNVEQLAEAAMTIVRNQIYSKNVIKIEMLQNPDKPIYALTGVDWGCYRDAHVKREKYWYFGAYRKYATYIFNGYKTKMTWDCEADLIYTPPCGGCTNCRQQSETKISGQELGNNRWWTSFTKKPQPILNNNHLDEIINENCSKMTKKHISTSDFNLIVVPDSAVPKLQINLGPSHLKYLEFVEQGFKSENGKSRDFLQNIDARQIEIHPVVSQDDFYSIDNEEFEVKPIRVTLLPKILQIFATK